MQSMLSVLKTLQKPRDDCDFALQLAKSFIILKASMADVDRLTEDLNDTEILIQVDEVYDNSTDQRTWDKLHQAKRQLEELEALKVDRMIQVIQWAARMVIGKFLPAEILAMIRNFMVIEDDEGLSLETSTDLSC